MKRLGLILAICLTTLTLSAQRGDGGQRGERSSNGQRMSMEDRQAKELEQLTTQLELTPAQVTEISKLQEASTKAMKEKRESMSKDTDRKVMAEEMSALREKYNEDVKALLTDDQKVKYEALVKEREEQMKQRQGQRQGGGQGGERGQRSN